MNGPAGDYTHTKHAGNVGDVWKHHALGVVLEALTGEGAAPLRYVETHAGWGRYRLGATGEWTAGVGRLFADGAPVADAPDGPWLRLLRTMNPGKGRLERYAGSPLLAATVLRPIDRATLFEWEESAHAKLQAGFADDARFDIRRGDGWAGLRSLLDEERSPEAETLAVIDPPFSDRVDWRNVSEALTGGTAALPGLRAFVWYPVKSLARPNALVTRLQEAGLSGTLLELVTKPFDKRKKQLNGSGVLLVRPPEGTLPRLAAALPVLGARCSHEGVYYSARILNW